RPFLLSNEVGRADLGVYHGLWFLSAMPIDCSSILKPYPSIKSWMKRIDALGRGTNESMTPRQAIEVARQATPATPRPSRALKFDPALGTVVAIRAEEYRTEEVVGEVVLLDQNELAIQRMDDEAGAVVVHFPLSVTRCGACTC